MPKQKNNSLAPPYEDDEVVETIARLAGILSHNFAFGYYGQDDIKQELTLYALQGLADYDSGGLNKAGEVKRPLEKFLFSHMKNRLFNLKRDKFRRADPPCLSCHIEDYTVHNFDGPCQPYAEW
jgi:hypothetical protein